MPVYALFDDETAELIKIRFLNSTTDKTLEIYLTNFYSSKTADSAKSSIECAFEIIFSMDIKKHFQKACISVSPKDFIRQVDDTSTALGFAIAFTTELINRKHIESSQPLPERIGAAGKVDNLGSVSGVTGLKQKVIAAVNNNVTLMFYPSANYSELNSLLETDLEFSTCVKDSGIILKHISSLSQAFCELGVFSKTNFNIVPLETIRNNILSFGISISNEAKICINKFSIALSYTSDKIKFDKNVEPLSNISDRNLTFINAENILIINFNCKDDVCVIKNDELLAKFSFKILNKSNPDSNNLLAFSIDRCQVNGTAFKDAAGFDLVTEFPDNLSDRKSLNIKGVITDKLLKKLSILFIVILILMSLRTDIPYFDPKGIPEDESVLQPQPSTLSNVTPDFDIKAISSYVPKSSPSLQPLSSAGVKNTPSDHKAEQPVTPHEKPQTPTAVTKATPITSPEPGNPNSNILYELKDCHYTMIDAGTRTDILLNSEGKVVTISQDSWHNTEPPELTNVTAVAVGEHHFVALKNDGTVAVWGSNSYEQCDVPEGLTEVKSVCAGYYHTVALRNDGSLVIWGSSYPDSDIPKSLEDVISVSAGYRFTVALKSDGTVVAWGNNGEGQCNVPEDLKDVKSISAGYLHTAALKNDGTVVAWGYNASGQCNVPEDLKDVKSISAGGAHTVALKNDGTVVAWGYNACGQCDVPKGLKGVKSVSAGYLCTLALRNDGSVVAWGN